MATLPVTKTPTDTIPLVQQIVRPCHTQAPAKPEGNDVEQ